MALIQINKIDMSSIELLLTIVGLMLAVTEWSRTIKKTTTLNLWGETTVGQYTEGGEPYKETKIFNKERHYHIKSIRITCYPVDKSDLKKIMFRIEDQNGWLFPNFSFDEAVGHDVEISSGDTEQKRWELKATIGSDGFRQLKLFCYNRTGKKLIIRFEPLVENYFTIGDAIHWFFITWFPTLSMLVILLSNKLKKIIKLLKINIC